MKKLKNFILIGIFFCFFGCTSGVYVGEKLDGKHHGQGTMTYSDGAKYEGDWKHGKRHGQGKYTFTNGVKYVGEWKDGKWNGQGKKMDRNDFVILEGTFKNGYPWDAKEVCPVGGHLTDFKDGKRLVVNN